MPEYIYNPAVIERIGGQSLLLRLAAKPRGATAHQYGRDFEEIWAVFNIIKYGSEIFGRLSSSSYSQLHGDYHLSERNLQCFVDDFRFRVRGSLYFFQLKTGKSFPWTDIQQDFAAQREADRAHAIRASYYFVTDKYENAKRITDRISLLRARGEEVFAAYVFEFSRHYSKLVRLQPALEEYLQVLTASTSKVRNKTAFAHILLAWTGNRNGSLLGLLAAVAADVGYVKLPGREPAHIERIALWLRDHGLDASDVGGRLCVEFSGFSATFDVPCSKRVLNRISDFLDSVDLTELDILDWLLDQGF